MDATLVETDECPVGDEPQVIARKQQQEVTFPKYVTDDGDISAFKQEKIEVFRLPRRMTEKEIEEWVKENQNQIFPENSQNPESEVDE